MKKVSFQYEGEVRNRNQLIGFVDGNLGRHIFKTPFTRPIGKYNLVTAVDPR